MSKRHAQKHLHNLVLRLSLSSEIANAMTKTSDKINFFIGYLFATNRKNQTSDSNAIVPQD